MQSIFEVSAVTGQHCLVIRKPHDDDSTSDRIRQTCRGLFDVTPTIIDCTPDLDVDGFNDGLAKALDGETPQSKTELYGHDGGPLSVTAKLSRNASEICILVATDLDLAPDVVQVQVIELLRTRRVFARSSVLRLPKSFLFIGTISSPQARLSRHLNDLFAVSVLADHEVQANLPIAAVRASLSSNKLDVLRDAAERINLTAELDSYLHHTVLFMRNSRYVQAGVTAMGTRHLRAISKALAALHGYSFVTPTMVQRATHMVYLHRLVLASAETEITLQWGSEQAAVAEMMKQMTVQEVIEDVVASVPAPL